jgi:hypothetical protein
MQKRKQGWYKRSPQIQQGISCMLASSRLRQLRASSAITTELNNRCSSVKKCSVRLSLLQDRMNIGHIRCRWSGAGCGDH